jgi:hypothetical protein
MRKIHTFFKLIVAFVYLCKFEKQLIFLVSIILLNFNKAMIF